MHRGLLKLDIILIVLSIFLILAAPKLAYAQEAGYSHMCYTISTATPPIDGQWSSEWNGGLQTTFGTNANFTDQWYLAANSPSSVVYYYLIVETLDNTNDSGDFIQICFNGAMTTDSAPTSTDFAINFTSNIACTWYQGNGTGWNQITTPPSNVFEWKESFSSSPTCSTPHLILEMSLLKTSTALGGTEILGPEFWMLIQTYDANTAGCGLQAWPTIPPSNPDIPSTYGDIPYTMSIAPTTQTPTQGSTTVPNPTLTPTPTSTPRSTPTLAPTSTPVSTQPPSATSQSGSEATSNETSSLLDTKTSTQPAQSFQDIVFVSLIMLAEFVIVAIIRYQTIHQKLLNK